MDLTYLNFDVICNLHVLIVRSVVFVHPYCDDPVLLFILLSWNDLCVPLWLYFIELEVRQNLNVR